MIGCPLRRRRIRPRVVSLVWYGMVCMYIYGKYISNGQIDWVRMELWSCRQRRHLFALALVTIAEYISR